MMVQNYARSLGCHCLVLEHQVIWKMLGKDIQHAPDVGAFIACRYALLIIFFVN